jgi:pyruvate/2-oxoglutarate dehydrogenase complex dihydrolipoamide dehydrogenase (E3) component
LACGSVCGKVSGGYYGEHLAAYEAQLAVNNALSRKLRPVNYDRLPWVIFSDPQLARVGQTEMDARCQFQDRLTILQANYQDNPKALMAETDVGFLKIMVRRSGQIVGATIVGQDAAELIQIIALAMHHRLSIAALSKFSGMDLTYAQLVVVAARQWRPPATWLQIIDPLLQWWADRCQQLTALFDRFSAHPQRQKKTEVPSSSKS